MTQIQAKRLKKLLTDRYLAVGYARVSTQHQGDYGISLAAQRDAISEYANCMNYNLIEMFEDVATGVGTRSFKDRPGLQNAINCANKLDTVLIVPSWDRLSRHKDFVEQIERAFPDSDRIVSATEGQKMREAAKQAKFALNESQAKAIQRRTKEGMAKLKAQGAVFGNRNIKTEVQPLGTKAYQDRAQALIRNIADILRAHGDEDNLTYAQVADLLNAHDLTTLQGKEWNKSRVRGPVGKAREILEVEEHVRMISSPHYGIF